MPRPRLRPATRRLGAAATVLTLATAGAAAAWTAAEAAGAVAQAAGAGSAPAAQRSGSSPLAEPYGLAAFSANGVPGDTVAERARAYRRLYRAGIRAVRVDIGWLGVEPPGEPLHDYDFSERDRELKAITRAGLKVIGLLDYGHPDYSRLGGTVRRTPVSEGIPPFGLLRHEYYPPDDPRDFARYARAAARHYGDEVIAWEVWNEENQGWRFWPPREDPQAYAELLCATYAAVKRVDPRTPVLFGGVFFPALPGGIPGTSGPEFVQQSYDASPGLGRCYDVLAYHPYPYPFTAPELDVPIRGSVLSAYEEMRAVLRRNGDGSKPLWITEVGWPTHDRAYGVPERKQAQYVARMQAASFAQGLPALTWYTYGDHEDPSGLNQEAAFGFFRPDGSPKPAYNALRTFARVFRGTRFRRDRSAELGLPEGELLTGGRGFALRYQGASKRSAGGRQVKRVTALWLANESAMEAQGGMPQEGALAPDSVEVALPTRGRCAITVGHLGERRRRCAPDRAISLELGPGPIYVVERFRRQTAAAGTR